MTTTGFTPTTATCTFSSHHNKRYSSWSPIVIRYHQNQLDHRHHCSSSSLSLAQPFIKRLTNSTIPSRKTITTTITGPKKKRVYPIRKQFIFESYLQLFTRYQVCILFRHDSLTPHEWNSVRSQLSNLSNPTPKEDQNLINRVSTNPTHLGSDSKLEIQVIRTKMVSPVLKYLLKRHQISRDTYHHLLPHLHGTLASLTQPIFQPSKLLKALEIISKQSALPSKAQLATTTTTTTPTTTTTTTGRSISQNPTDQLKIDRLPFVVGLIDRNLYSQRSSIQDLARLPNLDILHQQILGLIAGLGSRLVNHIDLARAKSLIRTVDGFRETLQQQPHQPHSHLPLTPEQTTAS